MKKELDELKCKYVVNNNNNSNQFSGSLWLNNNDRAINLIQDGINHQLQKKIVKTDLLYRCSKDGDDNKIFHSKCDGIDNTLIIGESTNGRTFGGFTTQKWRNQGGWVNDDFSFLFQINDLKNYYVIKGKGGIYCSDDYGPIFVANQTKIQFCFQEIGKAFEKNNWDYTGTSASHFGYDFKNKYVLEGNNNFTLKDYEVYKLYFN